MVDTYIIDKDGNQANASEVTVPANRDFRGAWSLSGTVISEDLDKAKEIFKDKKLVRCVAHCLKQKTLCI